MKVNLVQPHVPNPSASHNTRTESYFLWAESLNRRSGVGNLVGQAAESLRCMWVARAQHPSLPLKPKGKSVSLDSAADAPVCSPEMEAPDPGPERRAMEKVGRSKRPPAVRKDQRRGLL